MPAAPNSAISHLYKIPNANIGSYHVKSGFPGFATTPSYITAVSASNSIVSGLVFFPFENHYACMHVNSSSALPRGG